MADANFLATYLKIGVDYEFNIKIARFNYTSFQNVRFLQKLTLNKNKCFYKKKFFKCLLDGSNIDKTYTIEHLKNSNPSFLNLSCDTSIFISGEVNRLY
jgi:hypothetical protein